MPERIEWVDKRSSRIWRGRMEMPFWRYIKGKGAWVCPLGSSWGSSLGELALGSVEIPAQLCFVLAGPTRRTPALAWYLPPDGRPI